MIILKDNTSISCPKCGAEINVSDILLQKVSKKLKKQYEAYCDLKKRLTRKSNFFSKIIQFKNPFN
jgi:hypothetical protein